MQFFLASETRIAIVGWSILAFPLVAGFTIGHFTNKAARSTWYRDLDKPPWQPPSWAFPVAWSILYVLIGIAGRFLWLDYAAKSSSGTDKLDMTEGSANLLPLRGSLQHDDAEEADVALADARLLLRVWWLQLAFNLFWTPLFFSLRSTFVALLDLLLTLFCVCFLILFPFLAKRAALSSLKEGRRAAMFLVPYLLWLLLAFSLNLFITWRVHRTGAGSNKSA